MDRLYIRNPEMMARSASAIDPPITKGPLHTLPPLSGWDDPVRYGCGNKLCACTGACMKPPSPPVRWGDPPTIYPDYSPEVGRINLGPTRAEMGMVQREILRLDQEVDELRRRIEQLEQERTTRPQQILRAEDI